jgi:hypothetical protein
MSEYLEEACWRENYRDLVGGGRMVREAIEESFGSLAPLPNPEWISTRLRIASTSPWRSSCMQRR